MPIEVREFVMCRRDRLDLDLDDLAWLPRPRDIETQGPPSVRLQPGGDHRHAVVSVAWTGASLAVPVATTAEGELEVDTSQLPDAMEASAASIERFAQRFNEALRSSGKRLDQVHVHGSTVTLTKRTVATAGAPMPADLPPEPDRSLRAGCLVTLLGFFVAAAVAVGAFIIIQGGDDDGETTDSAASEDGDAEPTQEAAATPDADEAPEVSQVEAAVAECGDFGGPTNADASVAPLAAGVPVWGEPQLNTPCTVPPIDLYASCDTAVLPCSIDQAPPLILVGNQPTITAGATEGQSQAVHQVTLLGYADALEATVEITADCAGSVVSGEADVVAGATTEVTHPIEGAGPCRVVEAIVTTTEGTISVPPAAFGEDGAFVVEQAGLAAEAPDPAQYLLGSAAFDIGASWTDAAITTLSTLGAGAVPDECLWFLAPGGTGLEALLGVLGECQTSYWGYASGVSDPGVELDGSDVVVGHGGGYVNPVGQVAPPVSDTDTFATSVPLFDLSLFPCGPGQIAETVCPDSAPEVAAGGFVAVSVGFAAPVPIFGDGLGRTHAVTFAGGPTYRLEQAEGSWLLTADRETAARAIFRDNALTLVIPQRELPSGALSYVLRTEVEGQVVEQPAVGVAGLVTTPAIPGSGETTTDQPVTPEPAAEE